MAFKKIKKRWWIIGGLVIVVLVALNFVLGGSNGNQTVVQADLAYVDDIDEIVSASGRIQPQTKVDIVSEVSAKIINVAVKEGDQVYRGQGLITLDTVQLQSDVSQARYSLDEIVARTQAAKTLYEKDKLEFERQSRLYEQQLTSETAYTNARFAFENSQANYEASQAQVKTARSRLEKAQDNLTKTSIEAPMDGVITYLNAEVGEIAQGQTSYTQGKTLMTVSDLSVFEVEVEVDESEIAKVATGQSADITVDAYRDTVFEGTVVEVGNSAIVSGQGTEDYTTGFRVKVRFAETDVVIRPGMSATVDITTARATDVILVPYASIVTREFDPDSLQADDSLAAEDSEVEVIPASITEDQPEEKGKDREKREKIKKSGVFCIREGIARFTEVETGIADDRNVAALTGVEDRDTIISGSFQTLRQLKEGDAVTVAQESIERMNDL